MKDRCKKTIFLETFYLFINI